MTIENALIKSVTISMEDYGCLTYYLHVEGAGWGYGIGGYCIGKGFLGASEFDGVNGYGIESMMRIMDTVGVERWEDLTGKYIRAEVNGPGRSIHKIGNIIKDQWFDLKEFFESHKEEEYK